ncbi:MAG: 23S rRNA (uracil(1939)-C(5))-methyltransferase RlmD [Tissierellia bacterium]|nr:23S rRNA (uracil(1939)-C(5))-methyltransferase RlmD [Tissierellia bacterium]
MKRTKNKIIRINKSLYPNTGIGEYNGIKYKIKNTIPGQTIEARLKTKKSGIGKGNLINIIEKSKIQGKSRCKVFPVCGGCNYQDLKREDELNLKFEQVSNLFESLDLIKPKEIITADIYEHYRNKMEYTFGDDIKDGPLNIGLHARGRMHDIVSTDGCNIAPKDFETIRKFFENYFRNSKLKHYNRYRKTGELRHLVLRYAKATKEILVMLVTKSNAKINFEELKNKLKELDLNGEIKGFLHIKNDSISDAVIPESVDLIFGRDFIEEKICGLKFKITPFSFFQTNVDSAKILYNEALKMAESIKPNLVYDLYSGTGTITQIMAKIANRAVGIEIVEEAVISAKESAKENGLNNVDFFAGDVFETLAYLPEKPDLIIVDPPREGIRPKALEKIIDYGAKHIIYISCNPKTMAENLVQMKDYYKIEELKIVDQYPSTYHVETVAMMSRK